jgi:hypothetical protein
MAARKSKLVGSLMTGHLNQQGISGGPSTLTNPHDSDRSNSQGPFEGIRSQIRMLDQRIHQLDSKNNQVAADYAMGSTVNNLKSNMNKTMVQLKHGPN